MKSKVINIIGPKEINFTKILAAQFGVYSEAEITLIQVLIRLDMFQPFHIDKHTRAILQREMNVPYTTMTTALVRLTKAGVINRHGKSIYFNPVFRDLAETDQIVFRSKKE